jgi:uncharacterized protein (DUF1501 family)
MARTCDCGRHGGPVATRREILAGGAAAVGLMALGPFRGIAPVATGSPMDLSRLVVLNMFGGNDTLNMFIPVTLGPYYSRRPNISVPSNSALSLDSGPGATAAYRLHPAMPKIAALWAEGSVAAVQRVGYPDENLSHFTSMDIFSLGVRNDFSTLGLQQSGWAARFADNYAPTPMGAVSLGVGRMLDFEGGSTNPYIANDLTSFRIFVNNGSPSQVYRLNVSKSLIQGYSSTGNSGEAQKALSQAHDLADQVQTALASYSGTATYANQYISQRMRDVAVLVQAGMETRVFYTGFGGFDTHSDQGAAAGYQATLFSYLDNAVGSFAEDMKAMGVWDKTAIYVLTEFGRRNYENGSIGTDHGHGFCALVIGGAVKGGVYGPALVDADINAEYPSYEVDFRSVYKDLLQDLIVCDPAPVFPEPLEKNTTLGLIA